MPHLAQLAPIRVRSWLASYKQNESPRGVLRNILFQKDLESFLKKVCKGNVIFTELKAFNLQLYKNLHSLMCKFSWIFSENPDAAHRPAASLRRRLQHKCFPVKFCKIFQNTFFSEYLRVAASENVQSSFSVEHRTECSWVFLKITQNLYNLIKKKLQQRCFCVNFAKF